MTFRRSMAMLCAAAVAMGYPELVYAQASGKANVFYAQLLADKVALEHSNILSVTLFARNGDSASVAAIGRAGADAAPVSVPVAGQEGTETLPEGRVRTILSLLNDADTPIGSISIVYAKPVSGAASDLMAESLLIRDELKAVTPKRETLFDPYVKGYDLNDTMAQRINQTLLARHPDVNVIAMHLTKAGDAKNKVWGINRPNFLGRDSDEVDTDTEKTGKIVMQVIPSSHRMEVHMPLLSPDGETIGTLCTVYFWRTPGEAADFYGRSLSIMEEARLLTPRDRSALFQP